MNFDRIAKSPNTSAAHRLVRWAQGQGLQAEVLEGLFAAYFTDGKDIGDPEVLADIGAAAGMDRLLILDLLARGEDLEVVSQEHQIAVDAGVTGVPFMIFAQKFSVIGAEPAEKLARAIDHAFVEA
jgi:predicted DsbA family dithiol-disulfide isomerase